MRDEICEVLKGREPGGAVLSALEKLIEKDRFLLERDVNERSITYRLAIYLQEEFPNWNVDCEYNRDGHDPKELYLRGPDPDLKDTDARTVFPDIIVHVRGEKRNLLVIEVKKSSSRLGKENDIEKLIAYRQELEYQHALFIELAVRPKEPAVAEVQWIDEPTLPMFR